MGPLRQSAHRATTAHLAGAYPFVAEGGLGSAGPYIGRDLFGGAFTFDPWELYAAGHLTNPSRRDEAVGESASDGRSTPHCWVLAPSLRTRRRCAVWTVSAAQSEWRIDSLGRYTHYFALIRTILRIQAPPLGRMTWT